MKINLDRIVEGTIAFTEAYRKMTECVKDGGDDRNIAVAQHIDENYVLINAVAGEFWAIGTVPDNKLVFWCDPDDGYTFEENFRDLLSAYLGLIKIQED